MSLITITRCESASDLDAARRIASEHFVQPNVGTVLTASDSFRTDVLIAHLQNEIVGVAQLHERPFYVRDRLIRSGLVDSVVTRTLSRGVGVGSALVQGCFEFAKQRELETVHLFARKAVDGFYEQFGFVGISSYPNITILDTAPSVKLQSQARFNLQTARDNDIEVLNYLYMTSYCESSGSYLRDSDRWARILTVATEGGANLQTIFCDNSFVGYFATKGSTVIEVGCESTHSRDVLNFLYKTGFDTFQLPPKHNLFRDVYGLDVRVSLRSCTYGGHMLALVNDVPLSDEVNNHQDWVRLRNRLFTASCSVNASLKAPIFAFNWLDEMVT